MRGTGVYTASAAADAKLGYVVGAAYEKPEIALRVALTYTSAIDHQFATTEVQPLLGTLQSTTDITLAHSVALDAQTGAARNTLLFGQIRRAEWSKWHVKPKGYAALTGGTEITGFDHDVVTCTVGLGRKLTDHLSAFEVLGYEKSNGGITSRLAPTDAMRSVSLGAVWTQGATKITAGVQYQKMGDAVEGSGTQFAGNHTTAIGPTVA